MDYSLNGETIEYIGSKIRDWVLPSETNGQRSRFLQSKTLLYVAVLLLILKIGTVLFSINIPINIFFADITKSALENLVNQTRQESGLKVLKENQKLNEAARLKAQNMLVGQYFDHTSPSGVSPWYWFTQAGYNYKYAGENLAVGFYESEEVYRAWLNSPSHKANIINPSYTEVGTAVMSGFGNNNAIIVVQEFASPMPAKISNSQQSKQVAQVQPKTQSQPEREQPDDEQKVLSQETELAQAPQEKTPNSFKSKISNYIYNNYEDMLQNMIYSVSLVVIGILLALIFFNFKITFKKQLVFRAVVLIIILSAATLIDKDIIVSLIPHQIII